MVDTSDYLEALRALGADLRAQAVAEFAAACALRAAPLAMLCGRSLLSNQVPVTLWQIFNLEVSGLALAASLDEISGCLNSLPESQVGEFPCEDLAGEAVASAYYAVLAALGEEVALWDIGTCVSDAMADADRLVRPQESFYDAELHNQLRHLERLSPSIRGGHDAQAAGDIDRFVHRLSREIIEHNKDVND